MNSKPLKWTTGLGYIITTAPKLHFYSMTSDSYKRFSTNNYYTF